jgi:hypothetical protein
MIGPYWPSSISVISMLNAAQNRGRIQSFFDDYRIKLFTTRTGPLRPMQGRTATSLSDLFEIGETHASSVSDKNGVKQKAFIDAAQALNDLRSDLAQIAAEGNAKIEEIQQSKKNVAQKLAEIVDVIAEKQGYAAHKSAQYGAKVTEAIQQVLTAEGDPRTAEKFAADNGIEISPPPPQGKDALRGLVEPILKGSPGGSTEPQSHAPSPGVFGRGGEAQLPSNLTNQSQSALNGGQESIQAMGERGALQTPSGFGVTPPSTGTNEPINIFGQRAAIDPQTVPGFNSGAGAPPVPSASPAPTAGPGAIASIPTPDVAAISASHTGHPSMPGIGTGIPDVRPLSPEGLAQSFNSGIQAGAPMSAGAESLSQAIAQGAHNAINPQFTPQPEFSTPTGTLYAATSPSSIEIFSVESSQTATPIAATPTPSVFAAPLAAAAPAVAVPPPMASAGPLPAYGAELRPAMSAVIPPAPPPVPSASAPTSAPVNPASGAGGITQPAVVNKAPTAAAPTYATSPSGLTESAVAATGTGAAAGAASAHAAAKGRLRRLVEAVARQEPRLRWAVFERSDGSTVLVTDVAAGWIPPTVQIPAGIRLLEPARRRGGLDALVTDAAAVETWTPGQYLPAEKDTDPVNMSLRARDLPAVDDLNWELTQATNWRDGLPRLAHTLSKAGIAGSGVLDTETDLLQQHLSAISDRVFKAYPDSVDAESVGNWQLLAAINALVAAQKTALNYHFAWFQALHTNKRR